MQTTQTQKKIPFPLKLVNKDWLDFAVQSVMPTWSSHRIHARVLDKIQETTDVVSIILDPNSHWSGHDAGQFALLRVRIDGVVYERCYSLSSLADGPVRMTVKRVPGGRVSNYIHDRLQIGDIVELSRAQGEFVWQTGGPAEPLLLVGGGIGITPLFSIASSAIEADPEQDIVLLYYGRRKQDFVFQDGWENLAARACNLRLLFMVHDGSSSRDNLDADQLEHLVSDYRERSCYCCGPEPLMAAVASVYEADDCAATLHTERFNTAGRVDTGRHGPQTVRFARSGQEISGTACTILDLAEANGVSVQSGCRMGICNTCRCTKLTGTVQNLKTGEFQTEPNTEIRLCSTRAVGAVELAM